MWASRWPALTFLTTHVARLNARIGQPLQAKIICRIASFSFHDNHLYVTEYVTF